MKLFQVHTGFYDPNISDGFYEGHTNIFVCAKDEKDARKKVKEAARQEFHEYNEKQKKDAKEENQEMGITTPSNRGIRFG